MNTQVYAIGKFHCYELQPGDGTRYGFGFVYPDVTEAGIRYYTEASPGKDNSQKINTYRLDADLASTFSGLGSGENYIVFYIDCGHGNTGFTYIDRRQLEDITSYVIDSVRSRLNDPDRYTTIAVLLALSVLVNDPRNVMKATHEMLKAPEYLELLRSYEKGLE